MANAFRRHRRGISNADESNIRRQWLGDRECWGSAAAPEPQESLHEPAAICSAAWVDAMFRTVHTVSAAGEEIALRAYNPRIWPPGELPICPVCGLFTPLSGWVDGAGVCLDCYVAGADLEAEGRLRAAERRRWRQNGYGASPLRVVLDTVFPERHALGLPR